MLKLFEFFEFLHASSFIWAPLIIEEYFVYPCGRITFLVLILAHGVGCDPNQS